MVEQEPRPDYAGKATVYLDQNVLDLLVKEKDPAFFSRLMSDYQVVYSDETNPCLPISVRISLKKVSFGTGEVG
ncbi:hypothetical protein [Pseudomonas sp. 13B_3.2_Bac1]|uniref:hypothetical protein n=1 Tax=Pseudomonas sp. 13B_3.2_Bac1 TaxID=2971623 RepID=UPI0021C84102|nr:hypothetical protein [Pseudomonas sp. 13B_3.2_Bac1]MCU1770181.1 hypothetical protein [Pseudomonas sp. 13B_3.2_Bac1]